METINKLIENPRIENGVLKGLVNFKSLNQQINSIFDLDNDSETNNFADFEQMVSNCANFIDSFNSESLLNITKEVVREITDSAFSQGNYQPTEDDYLNLEKELKINEINFYDSDIMIVFIAKNTFPDQLIYCQVDELLEIQDLSIS